MGSNEGLGITMGGLEGGGGGGHVKFRQVAGLAP